MEISPAGGRSFFIEVLLEVLLIILALYLINHRNGVKAEADTDTSESNNQYFYQNFENILPRGGTEELHSRINETAKIVHPLAAPFFDELEKVIDQYNKISGTFPFHPFEGLRHPDRQKKLVKAGNSWVSNVLTAPHVQGRAKDYVQRRTEKGHWIWNQKEARKLRQYIEKHFKKSNMLRPQIIVNNNPVDSYHFELKRAFLNT